MNNYKRNPCQAPIGYKSLLKLNLDTFSFFITLFLNQLSYSLGIGGTILVIDGPIIESIKKRKDNGNINEDYSILKSLYNKDKRYKLELFIGVIALNLFILSAKIEEWIKDYGIKDVSFLNNVNLYKTTMIKFGGLALIVFLYLMINPCQAPIG